MHVAWLALIFAGCVVLATTGGGHPPPMVLIPPLLVAGLVGHLLLLLVAWLLREGRSRLPAAQVESRRWPIELTLIALIAVGWAVALLLQIGEARPGELPMAIALIAGLVAIAVYVLRARRIRSILGSVIEKQPNLTKMVTMHWAEPSLGNFRENLVAGPIRVRNRRGELIEAPQYSASEAKHRFGRCSIPRCAPAR